MTSKIWRKHLDKWNIKDRKPPVIGKPSLRETTVDEGLLNKLPTTQQAQLIAQAEQQSPWEFNNTPRYTTIDSHMKELPPLDLSVRPTSSQHFQLNFTDQLADQQQHEDRQVEQREQSRPVSEMPSTSSIYTRNTPEMRHDFDPSSLVPPLFSDRESRQRTNGTESKTYGLTSMPSDSTLAPTITDKPRYMGYGGLSLSTNGRSPWQGASGETTLMTPIASATPMGTGSTRSISPVDEAMLAQIEGHGVGANVYSSPVSLREGPFKNEALQPAAELKTPTQADWEDGVSVGYDVSPWSTPSSRPPYGSLIDGSTPASYYNRRSVSDSPSYGRNRAMGHRFSTKTRTTNASDGTIFEEGSEASSNGAPLHFQVQTNGSSAHAKRSDDPVTPPMQQGSLVKQRLARYEQMKSATNNSTGTDYTRLKVGTFDGPIQKANSGLRTSQSHDALRDGPNIPRSQTSNNVVPPASQRISHFSWTTQGTGNTQSGHGGSPDQNGSAASGSLHEVSQISPLSPPLTQFRAHLRPQAHSQDQVHTPSQTQPEQDDDLQANTPPETETPPMTAKPPVQSIMMRTRPIKTSPHLDSEREHPALAVHNAAISIKRKPTPSVATIAAADLSLPITNGTPNPTSTTKPLPTTPSELSTHDYITTLSAQLTSLSHRKHNLLKMLDSLSALDVGHMNPMVVDLKTRRQTREKTRGLEEELADVRQKEHETGLKLLKAEKRRDQEAPSALWVRNVTA